jgi:hypothetical protein
MGRRDESMISRCHPCSPAHMKPARSTGTRRTAPDTPRPDNGGVSGGSYLPVLSIYSVLSPHCSVLAFAPQLPGPFRACARAGFTPGRRLSGRRRVRVLFLFIVVGFYDCGEYSRASVGCQFGRKSYRLALAIDMPVVIAYAYERSLSPTPTRPLVCMKPGAAWYCSL